MKLLWISSMGDKEDVAMFVFLCRRRFVTKIFRIFFLCYTINHMCKQFRSCFFCKVKVRFETRFARLPILICFGFYYLFMSHKNVK